MVSAVSIRCDELMAQVVFQSWNLELNDLHGSDEPLKEDFYRDGATPSLDADRDSGNKRQP